MQTFTRARLFSDIFCSLNNGLPSWHQVLYEIPFVGPFNLQARIEQKLTLPYAAVCSV